MIGDADIRAALEAALGERVLRVARRPSAYRTSFALDEVDAELVGGRHLALMLKDVGPAGLDPRARDAKPAFLYDPVREIETYRDVLAPAGLGTPRLYAADSERGWLLVERVPGVELYQVGARTTWEHVARWLGRMHTVLAGSTGLARRAIRYDERWYAAWRERAVRFAAARADTDAAAALESVATAHMAAVERLAYLPVTVIHGEFYASNVLVDDPDHPKRVAPVDWEQTAVGPGLIDLAALTSGGWDADARAAIAAVYRETAPAPVDELNLAACRLHLAMQWLGWSERWSPPPEHRQDWLAEATAAAEALGTVA